MLVITVNRRARKRFAAGLSLLVLFLLVLIGVRTTPSPEAVEVVGGPITKVENDEAVALTFDVVDGVEAVKNVLKVLEQHNARVTFFITGNWANANPDAVELLVRAGQEIGMLGYRYINLSQYPRETIEDSLLSGKEAIERLIGEPVFLFRPPNGEYDARVLAMAEILDLETVLWQVDSQDGSSSDPVYVTQRVLSRAAPGGIIRMRITGSAETTLKALPAILGGLKELGLKVAPVGTLLGEAR